MAKGGLSKLRCMIRRWHSSSRIARAQSPGEDGVNGGDARGASFHGADEVPKGLHPVYVGKSRRRYLIAEELVGHPLFQSLVHRAGGGAEAGCTVVGCELLWMALSSSLAPVLAEPSRARGWARAVVRAGCGARERRPWQRQGYTCPI